ncbi:hypothetical protein TELCIR_15050, partial [Teladorsagia circumcincta]
CVDDGLFLDLGRDLLMNGMVHRCYQVGMTTFYHKQSVGLFDAKGKIGGINITERTAKGRYRVAPAFGRYGRVVAEDEDTWMRKNPLEQDHSRQNVPAKYSKKR